MHRNALVRSSLLLGMVALCATALVALAYRLTSDAIARQSRTALEQALLDIIPRSRHDNAILDDTLAVGPQDAGLGLARESLIHIARQNGQVVAAIIPVTAPDGYAGEIELRVGVKRDGSLAAVRVLSHDETPGLGDRIELEHSDWLLGFNARSLANTPAEGWAVKSDGGQFDQFTGATITPRAVVAAVARALHFAQDNRATLFGEAETAPTGTD